MFENYIRYHSVDSGRRLRLGISATAASAGVFLAILFWWAVERLSIEGVDPPICWYKYSVVPIPEPSPPPPPPPPPPPAGSEGSKAEAVPEVETKNSDEPEEELELKELIPPRKIPDKIPAIKPSVNSEKGAKRGGVPMGVPGGVPGGVLGGVLGGVPGEVSGGVLGGVPDGMLGGALRGVPGGQVTKGNEVVSRTDAIMESIDIVKGRGIYTPGPDERSLQATKAAMFDKRPGLVKIGFCVRTSGRTRSIKVFEKFPYDRQVSRICANTVAQWRFRPKRVGGKLVETCSIVTFNIHFE